MKVRRVVLTRPLERDSICSLMFAKILAKCCFSQDCGESFSMNHANIQARFIAAGLSRLLKDIDFIARPSIRLSATPVAESTLKMGVSKLGGHPDLPPAVLWPEWQGLAQSFIAQICLDEVHPYDIDNMLPPRGMLWFFYDAKQQTFGSDPNDLGGWRVIFRENDLSHLERMQAPTQQPASSQFHACSLSFASEISLSQQPALEIPHFDWTDTEVEQYEKLLATFPNPAEHAMIHHRLLGNPDTLQDDMRLQCQLVSHGITEIQDPRVAQLAQDAMDWQLLLQIDSDEHAGMRWANNGMLYYWINKADLQAAQFDRTWLVLQSE